MHIYQRNSILFYTYIHILCAYINTYTIWAHFFYQRTSHDVYLIILCMNKFATVCTVNVLHTKPPIL